MSIHLIIKGNVAQAHEAARDRGVSLNRAETTRNPNETVARCASDYRAAVVSWFNEHPYKAPFPLGTLLLFTEGLES